MMEFIILAAIGCGIFGFCAAVFLIRGRKDGQPAKLHMCGQGGTCQCRKNENP